MGRLLDTLIDACGKFKPVLDPSACMLTLGSKPVDLDAPFRMLNLPANPRLEVQKGEEVLERSVSMHQRYEQGDHGHAAR